MAPRKVAAIGLDLHTSKIEKIQFNSKSSLVDWDVIVFSPNASGMTRTSDYYQGKRSLDDDASFRLKERCEHWRREIKLAVDSGKTVICYAHELIEVFVATGERQYSGTGRNRQTTRIVSEYHNYNSLPWDLGPIAATGSQMKLSQRASSLSEYWSEFGNASSFEVTFKTPAFAAPITTRNDSVFVGGTIKSEAGGHLVVLPMLDFYNEDFFDNTKMNDKAKVFAERLLHSWLEIDSALRSAEELTPAPQWSSSPEFELSSEAPIKAKLLEAETRLIEAQKNKEETTDALLEAGSLRALLYEKGVPLESAILKSLKLLGFEAEQYRDASSEFDVVFQSSEGRLLGEAEGKDTKPISIEKLRQLSMNIHEDLARDQVSSPAKGILFGNGYRLQPPKDRPQQFTEKCVSAASSVGLLTTTELFRVAKYVSDTGDTNFAAICRSRLLDGTGIIEFPDTPQP